MKRKISLLSLLLLASTYFTIFAYGSAIDSEIWLDKATYTGYGARPIITLQDDDLNIDPKRKDAVTVNVCSTSDAAGITVKLTETTTGSGEFTGDFGVTGIKSDNNKRILQISNKDTITVRYETFTRSAKWQASTGEVKLLKSSYTGINTTAMVTVNDKDLNLREAYIDTSRVRIYSDADPKGIILTTYETGSNTSTFAASFGFDLNRSDTGDSIIKVNPSDNIYAQYIDEISEEGAVNLPVTATSSFSFAEASIKTSAVNDEGSGNVLTVTIVEPDANNVKMKDRIIAKASSGNGAQEKTIWLDETGVNTGTFKCRLFLNEEATTANSLRVKSEDTICIKFIDKTIPKGGTAEVIRDVKWTYIGTFLKSDRAVYSGYNTSARVSLIDYNLNTDEEKAETIDVNVSTSEGKGIKLELRETGSNSGEFSGTLYFGKSSKASKGILRVVNNEIITVTYTNPKDDDDFIEHSFKWSFLDGYINLDRQECSGNDIQVKVNVQDHDASDNIKTEDEIRVTVRTPGGAEGTTVILKETGKSTGSYKGTFYINGSSGHRPSINLQAPQQFEVVYIDELNTSGKEVERIATSSWGGTSKATLMLDRQKYTGYGEYIQIALIDHDQNKNTSERDKVTVSVRTKSGKTITAYTLTETSDNTGEFTALLQFTEEPRTEKKISVAPDDVLYVDYSAKSVNAVATFTK